MFEEEEKKLEQRKKSIDKVEVPRDKLHFAVQSGFEKAKKERALKRSKIRKRSTWSIAIAAILLISFVTSISVSPVFASKVASIPGLEKIVSLIKQDRGLTAAVENDFYQPINLSQEKNGITVTLDGIIADKKGMVIFYSVHSKEVDLSTLEIKYLELSSGMTPRYRFGLGNNYGLNLTPREGTNFYSGVKTIEKVAFSKDPSWGMGIKNGDKIEHFNIPFTYKLMDVENKNIVVDKEVTIEGQRFKIKQLIVNPIRTTIKLEEDPNNSKKLLSRAFDELKLVDEMGRTWSTTPGNSYKVLPKGNLWEVPLMESFYFHDPKELTLTFGKVAAMEKSEAYVLIDTETKEFLEQPSKSIFSNLQVKDNRVSFIVQVDKEYDKNLVHFNKFIDANEKEFYIETGGLTPVVNNYVRGSMITVPEVGQKFEFELPDKSFTTYTNPIRLDLEFYPSWIEEDVQIEIK
ncbi:DUF4179 domain-containing protein [Psychrobacillus vulpis]|uniref:DUF4179 domain-containing protein n=1 Tax=Psychrobacillus vulpis TaxID=2325572 RepID=A0A544TSC0_9BACI|nr:DUF4179 domain-containing protein [Psychrobacillus vulpis]TQR20344.1 DUF4179 domain-containing protein [Psychrobacillus vulpis]